MEVVTVGVSLIALGLVAGAVKHLSKGSATGAGSGSPSPADDSRKSDNTPADDGQAQAREADTWASFDHTHHHSHDPGSPF